MKHIFELSPGVGQWPKHILCCVGTICVHVFKMWIPNQKYVFQYIIILVIRHAFEPCHFLLSLSESDTGKMTPMTA